MNHLNAVLAQWMEMGSRPSRTPLHYRRWDDLTAFTIEMES